MLVDLVITPEDSAPTVRTTGSMRTPAAAEVVFDTLPALGMDRMTEGRVEFVLCASALTAQV
jgi:hypothetical protein